MSVYLGDTKVGVAFHKDRYNEITPEQMAEFNDAVNYRTGKFDINTIPQMIEELKEEYMLNVKSKISAGEDTTPWVRPIGWPDLDSLNLQMEGNTDFIYMTYEAGRPYSWLALYVPGSNVSVTIGHITNGTYIVDETINRDGSSNNYYRSLSDLSGFSVVRVTGTLTYCRLLSKTTDGHIQAIKQQPLLERIAYVPNIIELSSGDSNWTSFYLQREKINNGNGNALTSMYYAYNGSRSLHSLDLTGLRTPRVTTFNNAFAYCHNLRQSLDLRHFDVSNANVFTNMFRQCMYVTEINLTGWSPKVLSTGSLEYTFYDCLNLKHIYGLSNFDISNCTTLNSTFYNCYSLKELEDLSNWDTSKITTFTYAFYNCATIKDLSFTSTWDTSNVTNLNSTFNGCCSIEKLDLHNWNVSKVTNVGSLFYNCCSLKQLNITGWQINSTTSMYGVFYGCSSLQELDLQGWHVTNACNNVYGIFYRCCSLLYLDLPNNWDFSGISTNTSSSICHEIFYSCYSLKRITGISNWNLNASKTASSMFSQCFSLEEVDVSGWNVSKITNFSSMFNSCYSLKTLDLSNWNTSSCTNMASMFNQCRSLNYLDLSNFDTSNVTNLSNTFANCYSLTTVGDISNWNVSKVTTLYYLFAYNFALKTIPNLNNWDVSKVTDASYIFRDCRSLKEITINNWNLASCTTIQGMFYYCYNLEKLTTNNWSIPKISTAPTSIYQYCYRLKDYNGTIPIKLNHNYNYMVSLTYESLINILNNLPTVTTTRTIGIATTIQNQLNTTEKAIATNKGWTITT